MKNTCLDQIKNLVDTRDRFNEWVRDRYMQVYVRKSWRNIAIGDEYNRLTALDIGNIEVFKKGRGTFTSFLDRFHEYNPFDITYVECVQNERLHNFLIRKNFTMLKGDYPNSFYKFTDSYFYPD